VRCAITELEGAPSAGQRANVIEGSEYDLPCSLVLKSVGYRSSSMKGVPFDRKRGIVPNEGGRVEGASALYVTGWLRRGPNGVILTNVNDAAETASALLHDRQAGLLATGGKGGDAVRSLLAVQQAPVFGFNEWKRIDDAEVARGSTADKVREKIVDIPEMLSVGQTP